MEVKDYTDYIEELSGFYPQIEEKDLKKMMKELTHKLVVYMRPPGRGFIVSAESKLIGSGINRFTISKVFGYKHLDGLRKIYKLNQQRKIDGKTGWKNKRV